MTTDEAVAALVERRMALGFTRQTLAGRARRSPATVKRMERGEPVSGPSARAVIEALGLDLETYLVHWTASPTPPRSGPSEADAAPPPVVETASSPVPTSAPTTAILQRAAGDGRAWATAWRELLISTVALLVFFSVKGGEDRRPEDYADPYRSFEAAKVTIVQNQAIMIACVAVVAWLLGTLAWRQVARRRWRVAAGRRVAIPRTGLGFELPSLRHVRPDGRRGGLWVGGALGVLAIPALMLLGHFPVSFPVAGYVPDAMLSPRPVAPLWELPPDSALARAGARIGDELVAVDGSPVRMRYETLLLLNVPEGRAHVLTVRRDADGPALEGRAPPRAEVDLRLPASSGGCRDVSRCFHDLGANGLFTINPIPTTIGSRLDDFGGVVAAGVEMITHRELATCAMVGMPENGQTGLPRGCATLWPRWMRFSAEATHVSLLVLLALWAVVALGTLASGLARFVPPACGMALPAVRGSWQLVGALRQAATADAAERGTRPLTWVAFGVALCVAPTAFGCVTVLVERSWDLSETLVPLVFASTALVATKPMRVVLDAFASAARRIGALDGADPAQRLAAASLFLVCHLLAAVALLAAAVSDMGRVAARVATDPTPGWVWLWEIAIAAVVVCSGAAGVQRFLAILDGREAFDVGPHLSAVAARLTAVHRRIIA